jgi:hypothetical protein
VGNEPILEHIGCFLGKIAATSSVECVLIHADMLLEANVARVAILVPMMRWTRVCGLRVVVRIMRPLKGKGGVGWFWVVAGSMLIRRTMLHHGLRPSALASETLSLWLWSVRQVALLRWGVLTVT